MSPIWNWNRQEEWPYDTKDHVFLLRAVKLVAKKLFGTGWQESYGQFDKAIAVIREECGMERLRSVSQQESRNGTGALLPLSARDWNTKQHLVWFRRGQIADSDLGFSQGSNHPRHWLFIERKGLELLLSELSPLSVAADKTVGAGQAESGTIAGERPSRFATATPEFAPADGKDATAGSPDARSEPRKPPFPMKKCVSKASDWLEGQRLSALTRQEAEDLLAKLYAASTRAARRSAVGLIPLGKRRRSAILINRLKELDDLRRFLLAAK